MTAATPGAAKGPLVGLRGVELVGVGPAPYAAMLLSDLGADIIRVDRVEAAARGDERMRLEVLNRGRRSVAIDLRQPSGVSLLLDLVEQCHLLIDPYRPGVTERMGLGPDTCLARRPDLVYGRMTGWGQTGPLRDHAGHDINFIALAGALAHIGRTDAPPTPPLNLVGDMGGGGLFLAFGMMCALFEAAHSGAGQVVDAAMIDGVASLMSWIYGLQAQGHYSLQRGTNVIDSGAPFYDVYECADGRYISVGPIEARFYADLLRAVGLDLDQLPPRRDRESWPVIRARLADTFRSRSRQEWCDALAERPDICFAPVLDMVEAAEHPHHVDRGTFLTEQGVVQAAPAPRFSRTAGSVQRPPALPGEHTDEVLHELLNLQATGLDDLRAAGIIA